MTPLRKTVLLVASFAWVLAVGVAAYWLHPEAATGAAAPAPNPFWSVTATGDASVPFRVQLRTAAWLACTLVPVVLAWSLAWWSPRRAR